MLCPRSRLAMRACCSELMLIVDKQCVYEQFVRTQNKHQKYNNFNKQPLRVDRAAGFCTLLIANAGLAGGSQAERFAAACALRPYLPRVPRELNETAHALRFDQSGFWIGQCVVTAKTCKPRSALDALVAWGTLAETNVYLNAWALRPVHLNHVALHGSWWVETENEATGVRQSGELLCWNDATKIPLCAHWCLNRLRGPSKRQLTQSVRSFTCISNASACLCPCARCAPTIVFLCLFLPFPRLLHSLHTFTSK